MYRYFCICTHACTHTYAHILNISHTHTAQTSYIIHHTSHSTHHPLPPYLSPSLSPSLHTSHTSRAQLHRLCTSSRNLGGPLALSTERKVLLASQPSMNTHMQRWRVMFMTTWYWGRRLSYNIDMSRKTFFIIKEHFTRGFVFQFIKFKSYEKLRSETLY